MNPQPPVSLWPDAEALGPATDMYQLTMMAGYAATGKDTQHATFELFVRRLPSSRNYLVFAGLEQAIGDLLRLSFSKEQVEGLRRWPAFAALPASFFDSLTSFRFEGDVWAMPEGTVVFAGETLLRVTAALPQAQLVETFLLSALGYPTLVASKAARVVRAAAGRPVYDFGARRGHGPHAAYLAARSAYLAGCAGTSHVDAALRLGIPCSGTMAHSWVQSFDSEAEAFAAFARVFPHSTLLIDTYDTAEGARRAAAIEPPIGAVRLDSGDLAVLAPKVRAILDDAGRPEVQIFGSGDLDEFRITDLLAAGAPFDAFGVGTEMIVSRDAPALAIVYKLVELDGTGRIKLSPGKRTYPFAKQVYRISDSSGRFLRDRVTRAGEGSDGEPLLVPVVQGGALVGPLPSLDSIRARCRDQLAALPEALHALTASAPYPIEYSDALEAESARLMRR